jgi:hypothetical protein
MDNYTIIRNAIINLQQIKADFNGYYREMCPHILGTRKGVEYALFYQFGGYNVTGAIDPNSTKNWLCITIDALTNVKAVTGDWHTGADFFSNTNCIDLIDVEVTP